MRPGRGIRRRGRRGAARTRARKEGATGGACAGSLYVLGEPGDERLREGVAEDELRADDEDLRGDGAISPRVDRTGAGRTLGVRPLKSAAGPSCLTRSRTTAAPETLFSKLAFWMRVLTVSSGAATVMDATAPATDATKFWPQVALW